MTSWLEVGFEGFYGPFLSQNFSHPKFQTHFHSLKNGTELSSIASLKPPPTFPRTDRLTSIGGEKPEFIHLDNDAKADATTHELQQIDGPLGEKLM